MVLTSLRVHLLYRQYSRLAENLGESRIYIGVQSRILLDIQCERVWTRERLPPMRPNPASVQTPMAHFNNLGKLPTGICRDQYPETTCKNLNGNQFVVIGMDLLPEVNESSTDTQDNRNATWVIYYKLRCNSVCHTTAPADLNRTQLVIRCLSRHFRYWERFIWWLCRIICKTWICEWIQKM